jgi:O-antigen/teichoic acid export membrane protein
VRFDRGPPAVRLIRRVLVLLTGEGAARVLGIVTVAILARALGVEGFGILVYAMSLALVMSVGIDMGQILHVGRLVAKDEESGGRTFVHVALNQAILTVVFAVIACAGIALTGAKAPELVTIALMTAWAGGLNVFGTLRSISRATDRFRVDGAANGLESLLRLVAVVIVWKMGAGLVAFAVVFAIESPVAALCFWLYLRKRVNLKPEAVSLSTNVALFRDALPLGIASLGMAGFYRIDQVLVRLLASTSSAGLYGAAARVALTANVIAAIVMMVVYPELVRLRNDPVAFARQMRRALLLAVSCSATVAAIIFALAEPIVSTLYGAEFLGAVPLLRILVLVIALNAITIVSLHSANSLGRERRVVRLVLALTATNMLLNFIFVPRMGAYAAAWISAIGEGAMAVGLLSISIDRLLWRGPRDTPRETETASADSPSESA